MAVLFLAAPPAAVHFRLQGKQREMETEGLVYKASIVERDIPGKTSEERQRKLNSIAEKGMPAMSADTTPCGGTTGADGSTS